MILITGATGTVGSEVVKRLSAQGIQVRAVTRDPQKLDDAGVQPTSPAWSRGRPPSPSASTLVVKHVSGVRKTVRWHCPFYGMEGQAGSSPSVASSTTLSSASSREPRSSRFRPSANSRTCAPWMCASRNKVDAKQLATWIKQAASIPGWDGGSTVRACSG
jgi:hypothetical protein